jgi:hypothetical protein
VSLCFNLVRKCAIAAKRLIHLNAFKHRLDSLNAKQSLTDCLVFRKTWAVSILVMANGDLPVDIDDDLSAAGSAAIGSGGSLDPICGGDSPLGTNGRAAGQSQQAYSLRPHGMPRCSLRCSLWLRHRCLRGVTSMCTGGLVFPSAQWTSWTPLCSSTMKTTAATTSTVLGDTQLEF